jgi:hypothetical protein
MFLIDKSFDRVCGIELTGLILNDDCIRNCKEAVLTLLKAISRSLKIQIFRDVKLCPRSLLDPEGGGTAVVWNVKN